MGILKIRLLFTTGGVVSNGEEFRDATECIPVKIQVKREQQLAILRIQKEHGTRLQVKEILNPIINAQYAIPCMMENYSHPETKVYLLKIPRTCTGMLPEVAGMHLVMGIIINMGSKVLPAL